MNIKPVATATIKSTNERYFIYNIASYTTENKVYALWVDCKGHVVSCSCPDHKYRHHDCKHMRDLQAEINECIAKQAARKAAAHVQAEQVKQQEAAKKAQENYQAWKNSVWNSPLVVTNSKAFPNKKVQEHKRAPQFAGMDHRGFVVQAVPELGGRMVPMKAA